MPMWKYRHTALIIFALALPCFGQFSEIWTNGDLFATEQMASQCYSGTVERLKAVGLSYTNDDWGNTTFPWWDFSVGKNHSKCQNVKDNLAMVLAAYTVPVTNLQENIESGTVFPSTFTASNMTAFAGLPPDFFANTPYFKLQYTSSSNGWHGVKKCIQALHVLSEKAYLTGSNAISRGANNVSTSSYADAWASCPAFLKDSVTNQAFGFEVYTGAYGSYHVYAFTAGCLFRWNERIDGFSYSYCSYGITNFSSRSTIYLYAKPITDFLGGSFDPQGFNVSTNYLPITNWNRNVGDVHSPYFTIQGDFTALPPVKSTANFYAIGWYTGDYLFTHLAVHDLGDTSITNGFKYK